MEDFSYSIFEESVGADGNEVWNRRASESMVNGPFYCHTHVSGFGLLGNNYILFIIILYLLLG